MAKKKTKEQKLKQEDKFFNRNFLVNTFTHIAKSQYDTSAGIDAGEFIKKAMDLRSTKTDEQITEDVYQFFHWQDFLEANLNDTKKKTVTKLNHKFTQAFISDKEKDIGNYRRNISRSLFRLVMLPIFESYIQPLEIEALHKQYRKVLKTYTNEELESYFKEFKDSVKDKE